MAAIGDDGVVVKPGLTIPDAELTWRFTGSGGPGGQHANTANTRVELVFDVAASASLTAYQRARILARLGPTVRVVASDERSQARNRALARDRLAERLRSSLRVQAARRPTRPTKGSVERRLASKRRQSDRKRQRREPPSD